MNFIRYYLYFVIICLIVEGILAFRLLRYRKRFNILNEISYTIFNSFVPFINIYVLIVNISLVFSNNKAIKEVSQALDITELLYRKSKRS